jgi:pSer/pThr/pTyr-binding forkhead associated (FHA) protein
MHCDIDFNSSTGIAVLRDLQSRNGTFVNSERVQSADVPLMHGDYIRAGYDPENFKFEYANPPAQGVCRCATRVAMVDHYSHRVLILLLVS